MKQKLPHLLLTSAVLAGLALPARAFTPEALANLNADVNGITVTLSWEWGDAVQSLFNDSFERETFGESWTLKKTYSFDELYGGNWAIVDSSEMEDVSLTHDGNCSALLMYAAYGDDDNPSTYHKDEWLMTKPAPGGLSRLLVLDLSRIA